MLLPLTQREDKVTLIETPEGHRLLVNLLLSRGARVPASLPGEIVGTVQATHRLRNGAQLIALSRTFPLSDADRVIIAQTLAQLRVNFTREPPSRGVFVVDTCQ